MKSTTARCRANVGKSPRSFVGNRSLLTLSGSTPQRSLGKNRETSRTKGKPFQFEHASPNRSESSRRNRWRRRSCPHYCQKTAGQIRVRHCVRHFQNFFSGKRRRL